MWRTQSVFVSFSRFMKEFMRVITLWNIPFNYFLFNWPLRALFKAPHCMQETLLDISSSGSFSSNQALGLLRQFLHRVLDELLTNFCNNHLNSVFFSPFSSQAESNFSSGLFYECRRRAACLPHIFLGFKGAVFFDLGKIYIGFD